MEYFLGVLANPFILMVVLVVPFIFLSYWIESDLEKDKEEERRKETEEE